jgi:imidazolonepropionase-like amidohydrolase
MENCPQCENVFDAHGAFLFPGFVDAHSHIGLFGDSVGFEAADGNEETDPCTPHLRAIDGINPNDRCFSEAASAGITTVITGPGSANAIGGQFAAIKTVGKYVDEMVIKAPCAMKMSLGENPKTVYHEKNQSPTSRMTTAAMIREQLTKSKKYLEQYNNYFNNREEEDQPEFDAKCEALLPVLKKEIPVHFHAHRLDDIFTAIRICDEFDLDFSIVHGTAAHLCAEIFAQKNIKIMCGPIICDRSKPELQAQTPKNAPILSNAGVKVAIISDHPEFPVQYLPLSAAICVSEGLPFTEAINALTINAAKICGIQNRVGSITPGKDADFVIFDSLPNGLSKPKAVFINGIQVV